MAAERAKRMGAPDELLDLMDRAAAELTLFTLPIYERNYGDKKEGVDE